MGWNEGVRGGGVEVGHGSIVQENCWGLDDACP